MSLFIPFFVRLYFQLPIFLITVWYSVCYLKFGSTPTCLLSGQICCLWKLFLGQVSIEKVRCIFLFYDDNKLNLFLCHCTSMSVLLL